MTRSKKSTPGGGKSTAAKPAEISPPEGSSPDTWEPLATELRQIDPKDLKPRKVNARYMKPDQFRRLVENVRMDGKLTSVVLACQLPGGNLEILSGHHRTLAAVEVGLKEINVEVILTPLSEDRKKAIQLAHNAVSGEDNPALLGIMWADMGLDAKKYSGLTDDAIGAINDLKLEGISAAGIRYEELTFLFLPAEADLVQAQLREIEERAAKKAVRVEIVSIESFSRFFDAIVKTKEIAGVSNSAMAVATMIELALERLDQLEADQQGDDQDKDAA